MKEERRELWRKKKTIRDNNKRERERKWGRSHQKRENPHSKVEKS